MHSYSIMTLRAANCERLLRSLEKIPINYHESASPAATLFEHVLTISPSLFPILRVYDSIFWLLVIGAART